MRLPTRLRSKAQTPEAFSRQMALRSRRLPPGNYAAASSGRGKVAVRVPRFSELFDASSLPAIRGNRRHTKQPESGGRKFSLD
jgi:hypothetical protein